MKAKGGDAPETVQCILYVDLSDKDCLRLGLTHNTIDSCSMQMSFMDEVRLIRQVTFTNPQDNARRILRDVFSLKVRIALLLNTKMLNKDISKSL